MPPAVPSKPTGARPPYLFMSHAGIDTEAVVRLVERIERSPSAVAAGLRVWLDKRDLTPGQNWQRQIEDVIDQRSTVFAVYIGSSGVVNWVDSEVRVALARAVRDPSYRLIPIIAAASAGSSALPPFARGYQGVQDVENNDAELTKFLSAACGETVDGGVQSVEQPFLGLRSFREEDAHLFFGRSEEVDQVLTKLSRHRLVMVVGDSGSGKSSMVRAGVVPNFRGGVLADPVGQGPDRSVWHVVQTRPRGDPFGALADDLADGARGVGIDIETRGTIREWARTWEPQRIYDAMREASPPEARFLLVVDQFEELLTQCEPASRQRYIDTLLHLASESARGTTYVVLTMRADYYNLCSEFQTFYARLEGHGGDAKYHLKRMRDTGLKECIRRPLYLAGVDDTELFAQKILADIGDQASDLPLLQMALAETWQRRSAFDGDLLEAYISIGGVSGALAGIAHDIFESRLTQEEQHHGEHAFIRLVHLGDTGGTTRRTASRNEFSDAAWAVVQKLSTEDFRRLLFVRGERGSAGATVELSHEALVAQWPQYQTWLQASAGLKRIHDLLIEATKRWLSSERRGDLLTGHALAEVETLVQQRESWLSPLERDFVQVSVAAREQIRLADETRRRRLRRLAVAMGVLASITTVLGVISAVFLRQAREAQGRAEFERQVAVGREYLALAEARLALNAECALALVVAAFDAAHVLPGLDLLPFTSSVRRALARSHVDATHLGATNEQVTSVAWSPNGELVAIAAPDASHVELLTANNLRVATTVPVKHPNAVAWAPDSRRLAVSSADGGVTVWDARERSKLDEVAMAPAKIVWSLDGRRLAASPTRAVPSIVVRDVDARTTRPIAVPSAYIGRPAFDHGGTRIAVPVQGGSVLILDVVSGRPVQLLGGHRGTVYTAAWTRDGRLVSASDDGTARIWDVERGTLLTILAGHTNQVVTAQWRPDTQVIASASWDGSIRLWDPSTGRARHLLTGHTSGLHDLAWSPDGRKLVSSSQDGTVRLWNADNTRAYTVLHRAPGWMWNSVWSPDGRYAASASDGGTVKLWERESGKVRELRGHQGPVSRVAWSPKGGHLASGSADRTVRIWDVTDLDKEPAILRHPDAVYNVAWSPDEKRLATTMIGLHEAGIGIFVWDVAPRAISAKLNAFSPAVAWGPDVDSVLYVTEGTVTLWNFRVGGKTIIGRHIPGTAVWDLNMSPDGRLVASASDDDTIGVWSLAGGQGRTLAGHTSDVKGVAWSPDGRRLASGSLDGTIRIWDVASGKTVEIYSTSGSPVRGISWHPKGDLIVAADEDGMVKLFQTSFEEVLIGARDQVQRGLTEAERAQCLRAAEITKR